MKPRLQLPAIDLLMSCPSMGEDKGEGDQQIIPHPRIWSGAALTFCRKGLCRNAPIHRDVMLSVSEASVFPTPYEKQILRRRLRITL